MQKRFPIESLKHIVNSRIHRLEFDLKVAREIEETNKVLYQLEILECCRIVINRIILESTRKEDSILHFANIRLYPNKTGIVPEG